MKAGPRSHLSGKRILVTRASEQGEDLAISLRDQGAHVILIPTIKVVPVPFDGEVRGWPAGLSDFKWVAFASQNGVKFFLDWAGASGRELPAGIKVAAVGGTTAGALAERGISVDLVPAQQTGDGLGKEICGRYPPSRILLPRGRHGRNELAGRLAAGGWDVVSLVCYETVAPPVPSGQLDDFRTGVDAALFASPSSINNLWSVLGEGDREILARAALVPIGMTTRKAIESLGLRAAHCPDEVSGAGLVSRVVEILAGGK